MAIQIVDLNDKDAPQRFSKSLKEIGFAVLSHHPISQKLIEETYAKWYEFFCSDAKNDFLLDKENHDGFVPFDMSETAKGNNIKDLKEFYHYYAWGRCPSSLKTITHDLYTELSNLAGKLLSWIETEAPSEIKSQLSIPLAKMIENSNRTLFRILHYPPLKGDEPKSAIRAAAHEDIDLLTLLPAATSPGLQVQDSKNIWHDVPCEKGWIIVNTGDMLEECTQGYYPATTHRVMNPTGKNALESRLSMPLFLHPADEVVLSTRHTAGSYRLERLKELGLL